MSEFLPDNDYLKDTANRFDSLLSSLKEESDLLRDADADVFDRYMAHSRLTGIMLIMNPITDLIQNSMVSGHALGHKSLHTNMAKRHGWHKVEEDGNPFFISTDDNKDNSCDKHGESLGDLLNLLAKLRK